MAYSNIDNLNLGKLLQIVFSNGVRNQISEDFRDWEMIKRAKTSNTAAREIRFMFQSSLGPSAIQYAEPGASDRAFPNAQQVSVEEYTAKFKELNATIELEYNLFDRARKSPEKYAEPLALEIQSKTISCKRRLAADLYGDGTGVVGEVTSAADTAGPISGGVDVAISASGGNLVFTLRNALIGTATITNPANIARGHVGFFEFGDLLVLREPDGTASLLNINGGTFPTSFRVIAKDRANHTVTLQPLDGSGVAIAATVVTAPAGAGEVFYRTGQPTGSVSPLDLTAIADYGVASEVIAGLESLTASDGRTIHGIGMQGSTAGSLYDAQNTGLDVSHIQAAMDNAKVNVGQGAYSWKMMCMSPESHAALIEARETDRRFNSIQDASRGINVFSYQHGNDSIETYTSEYVPPKRIYIKPEAKNGNKVMEYWGSDFEPVKMGGMDEFHLKATGAGYVNTVQSFLSSIGVLICKHPASIARIENFTV